MFDAFSEIQREMAGTSDPMIALYARPERGQIEQGEWTFRAADGKRLPVQISISPLCEVESQVSGFLLVADDITERKQLRQSEKISLTIKAPAADTESGDRHPRDRLAPVVAVNVSPVRRRSTIVMIAGEFDVSVGSVVGLSAAVAGASPASAEGNGVGATPAMGWSSWSYIRHDPTATNIEAQANALKSSGLSAAGYVYANIDDFWYVCPGSQGPDVDAYGRWVSVTRTSDESPRSEPVSPT